MSSSEKRIGGTAMLLSAGISRRGRAELARVLQSTPRFVTPTDVVMALGVDAGAAAKKLARWAEEGWLRRVRRGLYIAVPVDAVNPAIWSEDPLVIAAEIWPDCYFTGWTAARHWALSEQVFRTTVLKTSGRVRSPTAQFLDHDYLVNHVGPEALSWGLKPVWRGGIRLRFADAARSVVEILDSPALGGGIRHVAEVLTSYMDDHDPQLLVTSGDRLGNRAVFKRLGYLAETLGFDDLDLLKACEERVSAGISALDPSRPLDGPRVMRWGLRVNAKVAREGAS
jgi:predicted transcriptional regulator of viral defense system